MSRTAAAVVCLALVALTSFALGRATAAPAPRADVPAIVGELGNEIDSPVVYLPTGGEDDEQDIYWLVFTDPSVEAQVLKLPLKSRVAVFGRVGAGGAYRYVVATSVKADE